MTAEKNRRFSRVLDEYLKNDLTDFTRLMSILGNLIKTFLIFKRLKIGHSLLPWEPIHKGVLG